MVEYPFIGVSGSINAEETQHFLVRKYMRAIVASGGVPLMMSPDMDGRQLSACLDRMDGLLLAGGNDVAPELFGQEPIDGLSEVNPLRDQFELRLIREAVARGTPVLGICRGIQVMNAALGGTLYQDLPGQYGAQAGHPPIKHTQTCPGRYASHGVRVMEGTLLSRVEGAESFRVNSFHHQAVWEAAPELRVCALASDGVIEGVEHVALPFFLAVQWHPERMYDTDAQAGALFAALIAAACEYARQRDKG